MLSTEVGYRTFDFLNKRRTMFTRILFDKNLNENFKLGGGFAYFNNYQFSKFIYVNEYRPFIQFIYSKIIRDINVSLRVRDEWRIYEVGTKNSNRIRLQLGVEYNVKNYALRLNYENLYTDENIYENRYTIGFSIKKNKHTYQLFYALNTQSNVKYLNKIVNQSVLGLQFTFNNN
jgi:hypothetical protein